MSRFKSQFNYQFSRGEINNHDFMIDPTGYIPPKRQIENMLYAGALLDQSRLDDFDFREGEELAYRKEFDVRKPDFDRVDASRIMSELGDAASQSAAESGSGNSDSSESAIPDAAGSGTESGDSN